VPPLAPELEPLLRVALVTGVGPARLGRLLAAFGSAEGVLRARVQELRAVPGIGAEVARRIARANGEATRRECDAALRRLEHLGAAVLVPGDPLYPSTFDHLPDPPFLLFSVGDLEALRRPSIAIVGTRAPTPYGESAARRLGRELAEAGFVVVSGLARGVDSAAHMGALDAGGATVGVLGHGIDRIYPPENRKLFDRVGRAGLLLTEYAPGETPRAGNFPRRNRLITALAEAIVVVEMGHRSGAQHTVTYALEQGKEVLAVPGPISSQASAGTNQLIRDGAPLVTCAIDVLEELRGVGAVPLFRPPPTPTAQRTEMGGEVPSLALLTTEESRMLAALSVQPEHVDTLAASAGLSPSQALATLLELELRGLVGALPGKRFART
jgi:DNA processing protein